MKIAIDLDNTLIDYSPVYVEVIKHLKIGHLFTEDSFSKSKDSIKEIIKSNLDYGNETWIRFQGLCYGKYLNDALLYEDSSATIQKLQECGIECEIVSHKSSVSLCGEFMLQDISKKFISENLPNIKTSFFETSIEKIDYLNQSDFNIVIDDLESILDDITSDCLKIKFGNSKKHISLPYWKHINSLLTIIKSYNGTSLKVLGKSVLDLTNTNVVIKCITDSDRYYRELSHLMLLKGKLVAPEIVEEQYPFLIIKKIPNRASLKITNQFKEKFSALINELRGTDSKREVTHFCDSTFRYCSVVESRVNSIVDHELKAKCRLYLKKWRRNHTDQPLNRDYCLPDLCKKNLIYSDNTYFFIDFESAGYGSPERAFLNLLNHPSHVLEKKEQETVLETFIQTYKNNFSPNLALEISDLNTLDWCIIKYNYNQELGEGDLHNFLSNKKSEQSLIRKSNIYELLKEQIS